MRIFFDRQFKQMQVVTEIENLSEFVLLEVYRGTFSPLEEPGQSKFLADNSPTDIFFIDFKYSYRQTGNVYLVGVLADGNKRAVSSCSISSGTHHNNMYDNAVRGLNTRKDWYQKLRSERVKIFFKSLQGTCTCWDEEMKVANPNCALCGGSGKVLGYVGSYFNVMIDNDFKKVKMRTQEGRSVSVEGLEGWLFKYPFVNDECILERKSGDRYTINNVTYKHFGGHLIEMSFMLIMLGDSFNFKLTLLGGGD